MKELKNWRNSDRVWLKDVVPLDTPFTVNIESSSLCNAKCIYCVRSKERDTSQDDNMPMNLFEKVIRDLRGFPQKIKLIDMYNSGEPLCNPNLPEMIAKVKSLGITETIGFTTNGLLFNPKRIDDIISSGVDVIRISLQGVNQKAYREICGVNVDFEKFVETLKYLYSHKKSCKIRMKIADIALKTPDEKIKFEEIFGSLADSIAVETIVPIYQDMDYSTVDQRIASREKTGRNGLTHDTQNVCYRPFIKIGVRSNGNITASCCDFQNDIVYGNAYHDNIVEIWGGSRRKAFLKMLLAGKRYEHPSCKNCMIPNDITNEKDSMDLYAEEILKRFD